MTDPAAKPSQHLAYIDALRGIAVVSVIVVHVAGAIPLRGMLGQVASFGAKGVDLFFIISAMTLMMSMRKRTVVEKNPTRNFFLRRFFRIAPAFYFVLVLYLIAGWFLDPRVTGIDPVSAPHALLVAAFMNGWWAAWINIPIVGQWSIAVEVIFYILLPILFPYLTSFRRAVFIWGTSLFLYVGAFRLAMWLCAAEHVSGTRATDFSFWWIPNQLPNFFYGIGLYFVLTQRISIRKVVAAYVPATVLIFLIHRSFRTVGLLPVVGLALTFFVVLVARYRPALIVNRVTRFLGKISFSVYLFHPLVISCVERVVSSRLFPNSLIRFGLIYTAVLVLVAPIALLSWSFIEEPGQKLCRSLILWLESRSAALQTE